MAAPSFLTYALEAGKHQKALQSAAPEVCCAISGYARAGRAGLGGSARWSRGAGAGARAGK